MIRAIALEREAFDVRSSGDRRNRVDAYFVLYQCPANKTYPAPWDWCCRFEVPRGTPFKMRDYETQKDAMEAKGYTL